MHAERLPRAPQVADPTENVAPRAYFNVREAAAYIGFSKALLDLWRTRGGGPRYVKLSHAVRYRRSDLDDFMAARLVSSTSETTTARQTLNREAR